MSVAAVSQQMVDAGKGAVGVVLIHQSSGVGHVINVVNRDGANSDGKWHSSVERKVIRKYLRALRIVKNKQPVKHDAMRAIVKSIWLSSAEHNFSDYLPPNILNFGIWIDLSVGLNSSEGLMIIVCSFAPLNGSKITLTVPAGGDTC